MICQFQQFLVLNTLVLSSNENMRNKDLWAVRSIRTCTITYIWTRLPLSLCRLRNKNEACFFLSVKEPTACSETGSMEFKSLTHEPGTPPTSRGHSQPHGLMYNMFALGDILMWKGGEQKRPNLQGNLPEHPLLCDLNDLLLFAFRCPLQSYTHQTWNEGVECL